MVFSFFCLFSLVQIIIFYELVKCALGDASQWTVERRLTDFYSLDAKLTEFHGEFPDAQLPPRRQIANLPSPSGRPESIQVCF